MADVDDGMSYARLCIAESVYVWIDMFFEDIECFTLCAFALLAK